jgi:hypothetical protein
MISGNRMFPAFLCAWLVSVNAFSGPTVVGNGDDGRDLEGFERLNSGKIVEARSLALKKLQELNIAAVPGLGNVIAEVKSSEIYITKKDISTEKLVSLGAFTNDEKGLVYARTFPRPYAATRFFPAARGLDMNQLVSLHIHESLHRALPANIRENEAIVSDIALSINTPNSSFDQINAVVAKYYKPGNTGVTASMGEGTIEKQLRAEPLPHSRIHNPSRFSIGYVNYADAGVESTADSSVPLESMMRLSSHLYPFGGKFSALGIGIDANLVRTAEDSQMGPLGISMRYLAWTIREFDIEFYARADLNSLSDEELKNSLLGRDVYKFGLTLAKRGTHFYVANDLEYTVDGETEQSIGNVGYTYEFGSIVAARVRFGGYYKNFNIGGFGEFLLSDNFKVNGGAFQLETGRNRILSAGPELQWRSNKFGVRLYGRYLLDSTKDTDYDFLGDIHGRGVGQGNVGIDINFFL